MEIAGLGAGDSKGEGLGNQFLANIREVDAIVHVVRCFEDPDIVHTMGGIQPIRDIEVITTELVLADLDAVTKRIEKTQKKAKSGDKEAQAELALLQRLEPHLNAGRTANLLPATDDEKAQLKLFQLLTAKPVLFACNVAEGDLADAERNPFVQQAAEFVRTHHHAAYVPNSAKNESEHTHPQHGAARAVQRAHGPALSPPLSPPADPTRRTLTCTLRPQKRPGRIME